MGNLLVLPGLLHFSFADGVSCDGVLVISVFSSHQKVAGKFFPPFSFQRVPTDLLVVFFSLLGLCLASGYLSYHSVWCSLRFLDSVLLVLLVEVPFVIFLPLIF